MSYEGPHRMSAEETFQPTPENARAFRNALGRFSTGVTVVTCTSAEDGPMGFTANSFASVSLDPPLVLWCPAKSSTRFEPFTQCTSYAIHILGQEHKNLADTFAKEPHFTPGIDWTEAEDGTPLLQHTLARFHCTPHAIHDAGDHVIAVGRVREVAVADGEPLLFASGSYGRFTRA
ncbi:MAG: flavin reductase family protein [Pseudomonadota bacterium]